MYKDVEETVRQCTPCAKNRVQERKRVSMIKLFHANEPLEFVAIDVLGPLPKTVHGNRFLLVISDRFSKLTRTIPMRTTTALAVAKAFFTHWVFAYGPPKFLLSDNGTQFTAKFFIEVCRELGIAKVFTTAYALRPMVKLSVSTARSLTPCVRTWLTVRLTGMTTRPRSRLATILVSTRLWAMPRLSWYYRGLRHRCLWKVPLGTLLSCQKMRKENLSRDSKSWCLWRKTESLSLNEDTRKPSIYTHAWRIKRSLRSRGCSYGENWPTLMGVRNSMSWLMVPIASSNPKDTRSSLGSATTMYAYRRTA
jgi:Integrase core domain